jgi:hypothetical protein
MTATLPPVTISIYFTNTQQSGSQKPPFNQAVSRTIPASADRIASALDAYFRGPTTDELGHGLVAFRSGFVSYRRFNLTDAVLTVYLAGNCQPNGTGYSIAQPLIATLKQFPGVLHVKIYDEYDHTRDPFGPIDSWPACLDVIFTSTFTRSPTKTPTPTPSRTPTFTPSPTATIRPTSTPRPTDTPTVTRSATPIPSPTFTLAPLPTRTPEPSSTAVPSPTPTTIPTSTLSPTPSSIPTATYTPTPSQTFTPSSTPRPTHTPTDTATPLPTGTATPTLTLTPINAPTRTPIPTTPPTATVFRSPTPAPTLDVNCNRVDFLGDVTIADNAILPAGQAFTKTWRVRNAGICPWTAAYRLVFVRGDQMSGSNSIPLPALVAPGQTIDLSAKLAAPTTPGEYQGFWQLQTPEGLTFGTGPFANGNLWVKIDVVGPAVGGGTASPPAATTATVPAGSPLAPLTPPSAQTMVAADLAGGACMGQWQANDGVLPCPGQDGDARGFVLQLNQANLEDGTSVSAPTLLTYPSSSKDGYILGLYPPYAVSAGDHFRSLVGCELNAGTCSVLFRLSYLDSAGAVHDLWTLGEFYDGHYFNLDLDLSSLAGQQVRLVISANSLGSANGDRALWVGPRIVHLAGGETVTFNTPTATRAIPSATTVVTATALPAPTATAVATPTPQGRQPTAPIPQAIDWIMTFFRHLFGGR